MWLTLLLLNNDSVGPSWWHHISSSSSWNNPAMSWLWNLSCETDSEKQLGLFLQIFLQTPKRCCHLSVGEAPTTGHFAYLCVKIVLNSCLGSTKTLKLRYLLYFILFFC